MKNITIKDIAKISGVSITTVSNVINGKKEKVSQDTLDRINKTLKDLNYIPNSSARSLVQNRSKLIGVIIPQTEDHKQLLLQNPFYSEIVSGIETKIREHGYTMILTGVDKNKDYLDVFIKWSLDGAIIMGIYKEQFYEELKRINIPIVLVDSYINDSYFYKIGIDDELGGYMAAKYLISKGHKKIALVTGSIIKDGVTEKRFLGYKRALEEASIFYNPDNVYEESVSFEHGYKTGLELSERMGDITAVFATADLIATGVISGFYNSGIKVPDDVSVIGFDDISITKMLIPPMTTIKQDIYDKGQRSVEKLIDAIEGSGNIIKNEELLPLSIIERMSVKEI